MRHRLIVTSDGSHTVFVPSMNESYHSVHGAIQESNHIFINAGLRTLSSEHIDVFEAGFGTGLNALLTALYAVEQKIKIRYITIEKFPLPDELTSLLNYGEMIGAAASRTFKLIHDAPWDTDVRINELFSMMKIRADLLTYQFTGKYDIIFFDAFGPNKQPEMWSADIFGKIAAMTRPGGVFVTYSSKGEVKRNLRNSGFTVKLLTGPPGKRHIIRAIKN